MATISSPSIAVAAPRSIITPARLLGWCGLVNILAGIFYGLETYLHPPRSITGIPAIMQSTVLGIPWNVVHIFGIVAFIAGLFGLIGLYIRQIERAGWIGLLGFVLTFVSNVFGVGVIVPDAFVFPLLARSTATSWLLAVPGPFIPGGDLGRFMVFSAATLILGNTLFCIAGLRTRVLPGWAWLGLLVGVPLLAVGPLAANSLGLIGATLVMLGNIWLGYALWRNPAAGSNAGS